MLVASKIPIMMEKLRSPDLLEHDHLLLVDFADDDPLPLDLDRHGCLAFRLPRAGVGWIGLKGDYRSTGRSGSSNGAVRGDSVAAKLPPSRKSCRTPTRWCVSAVAPRPASGY